MPEDQVRGLIDSAKASRDPRIQSAARAANCALYDGAGGTSHVCSHFDFAMPDGLAGADALAGEPRIDEHTPTAEFDSNDLVTTARATLKISEVSDNLWNLLVRGADPQNWRTDAPDYFTLSARQPGAVVKGDSWKGLLHEKFEWNWNPESAARYENLLGINYQVSEKEVVVDYWLEECLSTDFGLGTVPGGLDLDGGKLTLTRDGTTVTSVATKSLRYTDPPNAPDGLVLTLSYLTPAALALWLDAAVYNGAHQAIMKDAKTRSGKRSNVPRVRRPANEASQQFDHKPDEKTT
jgi:hypothetical protein